jgi:hypothetical protein
MVVESELGRERLPLPPPGGGPRPRYNIVSGGDLKDAARRLDKAAAL